MNNRSAGFIVLLILVSAMPILFQRPFETPVNLLTSAYEETEIPEQRAFFTRERWKHEWDMVKDPVSWTIPSNIRSKELEEARQIPAKGIQQLSGMQELENLNLYQPAGPDNSGGRTRAVAFDRKNPNIIIAGCVSGGIFRSTDGGTTWKRVSPDEDIHNLTALAQDPRTGKENIWYAGGGEPIANSASGAGAFFLGYGILKSTDNGATWSRLPRTITDINGTSLGGGALETFDNALDIVHKIIVNPANGHVYVAGHRRIVRSTDEGNSWNVVLVGTTAVCSDNGQTDIVCTNSGKLYAAVNGGNPDLDYRGIWTSTSGAANSWTRIAGGTSASDSITGWKGNSFTPSPYCGGSGGAVTFLSKRIVMALAPSNQNILYVAYENGESQSGSSGKNEADLFKLDVSSGSNVWTNLSANVPDFPGQLDGVDPFHVQEGYNLMVAVKPDNPSVVFLGGVNLFRSTDGFTTTGNTAWIGGYASNFPDGLKIYGKNTFGDDISRWSHPDIHALAFDPNNANRVLCGNDGGLQVCNNIMENSATPTVNEPVSWTVIPNYQTLQYYHVAMDPGSQRNNFIGGAQDNGTRFRDGSGLVGTPAAGNTQYRLLSGDGGAAAIAKANGSSQIVYGSTQFGNIIRANLSPSGATGGSIRPNGLTSTPGLSGSYGDFVTYFKINFDNTEDLYYANFNRLFRTTNASTVTSSGWSELTGVGSAINPTKPTSGTDITITALELSRGDYAASHVLYIGTSDGKLLRLINPRNAAANQAPTNITPTQLKGYISDIAVNPNNDAEIMVTLSNYTFNNSPVTNIFWTNNAKDASPTWYGLDGNLGTASFRSCMIVVKKDANNNPVTEYYAGTSVGLYSLVNVSSLVQSGNYSWTREGGTVLNYAVITSMDYRPQDNVLLIGTHGNGMYYTALSGSPDFRPNQNTGINDPVRNDKKFIQKVYPTVVDDRIRYQTGELYTVKKLIIKIFTTNGQLIAQKETGYASGEMDTRMLARGTYLLTITSSDYQQQYVQQFVK